LRNAVRIITETGLRIYKELMPMKKEQVDLVNKVVWIPDSKTTFKTAWAATLRRAKGPYFRIYDLRSTYATRLSAGGVADEWVTQLLRQGDAKVFKKYSQMKLQMKTEAIQKLNRLANEAGVLGQAG
jgi:integrase